MTRPDILLTLQKLGLTYYGAKAYYTLLETGATNPAVIAEESGIPLTKIYEVLKKLENKKWITIEKTRPATVKPRYPKTVLEEHKSKFNSELKEVSNELTMIHDKILEKEIPKIRVVTSPARILQITEDIMKNAKNKIMIIGSLYLPCGIELLKDQTLKAKERGVNVRIITEEVNKEFINIDLLTEYTDIKKGHAYYMKHIIVDDKENLLMLAKIENNIPNIDSTIVFWITSSIFASYISSVFEMEWNRSEYYNKNIKSYYDINQYSQNV